MHEPYSLGTELHCPDCKLSFEPTRDRLHCDCGGPLEQLYDYSRARAAGRPNSSGWAKESLWRYGQLLPVVDHAKVISLGEGATPLLRLDTVSKSTGVNLLLKDEGRNPTGSFKARGASVGVSRLAELGWRSMAMPSVGSGGSAWSAYAARAGIDMRVGLPTHAALPLVGALEPPMYGASVERFSGDVLAAFKAFLGTLDEHTLNVGAFAEPYRVEGEKTIMFELCEQLDWKAPDVVIWPTGGAAGLVGLAKGLTDLRQAGWIENDAVTIVSAQHEGCSPIAGALREGLANPDDFLESGIAPGVWVGRPSHGRYILGRVRDAARVYGAMTNDDAILSTTRVVAKEEGLLLSPEGALSIAAAQSLSVEGFFSPGQTVVCVNTASSLRYPHLMKQEPNVAVP